jgi:hypothetical protein
VTALLVIAIVVAALVLATAMFGASMRLSAGVGGCSTIASRASSAS